MRIDSCRRAAIGIIALIMGFFSFSSDLHALNGTLNDLKNVCSVPANPRQLKVINATAFLVANSPSVLTYNASNNTYSINTSALVDFGGVPVCTGSRFYGETYLPGSNGRTGFLVAPDMIMTASHAVNFNYFQWKIIFRPSTGAAGDPNCSDFTWANIPASYVYSPVGGVANTYTEAPSGRYDYAVIKLDRPVVGRAPLKIRRSGAPRVGDALISAGYPVRGGEKVDMLGIMAEVNQEQQSYDGFFVRYSGNDVPYNIHGFDGSSGSPIYNMNDDVVEQVVAYGTNGTWSSAGGCYTAMHSDRLVDNNGPIADVQGQIPRTEVLVSPLNLVVHKKVLSPLGKSIASTSNYSATTARTGVGGEAIIVGAIQGPTGPASDVPIVTSSIAQGTYTVPAGGIQFNLTADDTKVTKCGVSEFVMNVRDATNDQDNYIRHRFEVGVKEVEVTPAEDWTDYELGAPYNTKIYTIKNLRKDAASILVEQTLLGNSYLLTIDGSTAPKIFNLSGNGTSSDTVQFSVSINQAIDGILAANTLYNSEIKVSHVDQGCAASSQRGVFRSINVKFQKGTETFISTFNDTDALDPPAGGNLFGSPMVFDFDLSGEQSFCTYDIRLDVGFTQVVTPVREVLQNARIMLVSPSGRSAILWDRNQVPPPPSPYLVFDRYPRADGVLTVSSLHLEDVVTPPLGPDMLSKFLMDGVKGHWQVKIMTSNADNVGFPRVAKMNLRRTFSGFCN